MAESIPLTAAAIGRLARRHPELVAENTTLRAQRDSLLASLAPFDSFLDKALSGFSKGWEARVGPDYVVFGWNGALLKLSDLQGVRAAIAAVKQEGEGQ